MSVLDDVLGAEKLWPGERRSVTGIARRPPSCCACRTAFKDSCLRATHCTMQRLGDVA